MAMHKATSGRTMYQFKSIAGQYRKYLEKWQANTLWLSDPARFNDPLDLKLEIKVLTERGPYEDLERLRQVVFELLKDNQRVNAWFYSPQLFKSIQDWSYARLMGDDVRLINDIQQCIAQFGVSCFTSDVNHPLMWSHYADHHAGYGVQYELKELEMAELEPSLTTEHVQYVSRLPQLCLSEVLLAPHQTLSRMLATKSLHWAYENEWRLIKHGHKGGYIAMPFGLKITGLIAGEKMQPQDESLLRSKAEEFGVPMYRMATKYGYELHLEAVNDSI